MRARRLFSGVVAVVVTATVLFAGGVFVVPAQARECPPENDTCELEDFTDIFLSGQINVTGPAHPPDGAIAEFVTAVINALNAREQAIVAELDGMRVAQATAALRTVMGSRNMVLDPDASIRRDFLRQAAEAAYLAESLLVVTADPQTADELGQVGMAAYALYVTGTVATGETRPQPEADGELIIVLGEFIRFLLLILGRLPAGGTSDAASEAKDALEEAVERVRNRDPGGGGDGSQVLQYIALGDSYASGSGIGFDTAPGPVDCHRSHLAYSGLLAGALHSASGKLLRPVNVACHGAEIGHYEVSQPVAGTQGPQRNHLSRETTGLVTVSMSGNDLGFPKIVRDCLFSNHCGKTPGEPLATPEKLMTVQVLLRDMYGDILSRIRPDGQLVVLTYPNIVPLRFDATCLTAVDQDELNMLADLVDDIRDTVEDAVWMVASPRIRLVDMSDKFAGHSVCDDDNWANALVLGRRVSIDSFHPNAAGHRQYAKEIAQAIGLVLPLGL